MEKSGLTVVQLLLMVFMGLLLVPAGAHFFEMPAKIVLSPQDYMIVQQIYAGWALFGIVIFGAMILLAIHAFMVRRNRLAIWLSLMALVLIAITQGIFWTYTFPMNDLSRNWTVTPSDLGHARYQWEMSHAVNAVLNFVAYIAATMAVLAGRRQTA
jgi:hypothetical protein